MKIDLTGKLALVTGGTRGIGKAISDQLEESGARTLRLGKSAGDYKVDLADLDDVKQFSDTMRGLKIDILVNNAGINKIALSEDVTTRDFNRIQHVNVHAPFSFCRAVIPNMKSRGWGRILNIASIFGSITRSQRVSYTTSKAALIGMTKTLAVDYAQFGILANCLSPGFIDTELTRSVLSQADIDTLIQSVPMRRLGDVQEVAKIAVFLCSEHNSFITGQNVIADGGFCLV